LVIDAIEVIEIPLRLQRPIHQGRPELSRSALTAVKQQIDQQLLGQGVVIIGGRGGVSFHPLLIGVAEGIEVVPQQGDSMGRAVVSQGFFQQGNSFTDGVSVICRPGGS
jgi:hypothetical protein